MRMPDGTVYEEEWEEGQVGARRMIEKPTIPIEKPAKPKLKKPRTQKYSDVLREPRKPKVIEGGLSIITHLNVSQYINEKLLNKNSKKSGDMNY